MLSIHFNPSLGNLPTNKYLSIYYVQDTVLGAVADQRNSRGEPFSQGIHNFVEGLASLYPLKGLSMEFMVQIIVIGWEEPRQSDCEDVSQKAIQLSTEGIFQDQLWLVREMS